MSVSDAEVLSWLEPKLDPEEWIREYQVAALKAAQGLPVRYYVVHKAVRNGHLPGFRYMGRLFLWRRAVVTWLPDQYRSAVAMSHFTVDLPLGVRMDEDDPDAPHNPRLVSWRKHIISTWTTEYLRGRRLKPHVTAEELVPLWSEDAIPDDYQPDRWTPKPLTDPRDDVRPVATEPGR